MSVRSASAPLFEAIRSRHRWLLILGSIALAAGFLITAYVVVDWFVYRTSHEVLAVVAAAAILFGVQLLMLSMLSGMLIVLHEEQLRHFAARTDGDVAAGEGDDS